MGITGVDGDKAHVLFVDRQGNHHYDLAWKKRVVACALEPGASLSRVALDHGINTNLVHKWVRKHKDAEMEPLSPSPPLGPAFIPVQITNSAKDIVTRSDRFGARDLNADTSGEMRQTPAKGSSLSSVAKLTVSLPNGVKLSLECEDVRALTAVIGALSDVQTGR